MLSATEKVGEVVESGTASFVAQCYELYRSPPFGSLVKTGDASFEQYGVVYDIMTSSFDQGRRPIARGKDESSEADIYANSPQLSKLLRSDFGVLVIGYREDNKIHQYVPPRPPRIHSFVYECSESEVRDFSRSLDFINILVNARLMVSSDELVAAVLRRFAQAREDRHDFLIAAGKELAVLLGGQFNQLKSILGRIRE
jgi:hypothetical protein